ncbi:hypothetical protein SteCoe_23125 [Stentor coeruleus]|uniref:Cilia- and flagella-associated protein 57 n=1 Tax=Stentor coeruleus TaxID=5963 RepID=A0A1R2BKP8_9CILI|nr:hypothetical protein SteCoe_23125 [Stentor coeruleus]
MCAPDESILNGVELNIKSVIGIDSTSITREIQFTNEETLIYSAGPHIVMQDIATGKFICQPREESDSQVTLLKVIHDKDGSKTILGEAFSNNFPTLSYQDSETSHMLVHRHLAPSDHIIEVAISNDGIICYTLSHVFISAWMLKSQKLISYAKINPGIRKLEVLPEDENKVILGGIGYLRYWQLFNERKAIEESQENLHNGNVLDMQFIPGSNILLALCNEGKLLIFENMEQREISLRMPATCLAVSSQECLLGYNNEVDTYLIDKNFQLHFLHIFKLPIKAGIVTCAAYSPDECNAVVMVKCENAIEIFLVETGECTVTKPFGSSLCTGGIKGISVSIGKELICAYGYDKAIRVWSYSRQCKGIAEQHFSDNPCAAAIHPTGYQIAVGFENSLKIFYLLYDSLSLAFSIAKKCEAIAYSPCGKYLAFGQNNNICIYDPYTLTLTFMLQGHIGIPQQMRWKKEYLTSVCSHGTVHVWKLGEKIIDFSSSDFMVKQAFYDETLDLLACIHTDGVFRVWAELGVTMNFESTEKEFVSLLLCYELDMIILGMKNGLIRVMLWPIVMPPDEEAEPEWSEWPVHLGPVNYLSIAYSTIFTAGQDSMIVCLSAKQVKEGRVKQLVFKKENESLNTLSLIPQPTLDFQIEKIQQLNDSIRTLESDFFEFEQQEKKYEEKINELKGSYDKELNKIIDEYNKTVDAIEAREKDFRIEKDEKNAQYATRLMLQNDKFSKMLNDEFEKYEHLKEEMETSCQKYSGQREEILTIHKEIIEQCEEDYELRMSKIMEAFNDLQKKVESEKKKYEAIIQQSDKEFEESMDENFRKQKEEIDEEKKRARECLGKHTKLIRDNMTMQKEVQILNEKKNEYSEENKNLTTEKNNIQEKLLELDKEVEKREEIIKKRENKIKDLRSLHIHLQNYRFVLDQKINSLKDERIPMEEQSQQIQQHIKKLYNELLEESTTQNSTLKLLLTFKQKNSEALNTNQDLREELLNSRNDLNQLYSDLAKLLEERDTSQLITKLKDLYFKHVGKEDLYPSEEPTKPTLNEIFLKEKQDNIERIKYEKTQQEFFMQVMYKNMNSNKLKLEEEHGKQVLLKQQENARLINECYDLRQEKDFLNKKISDLEAEIKRINYSHKGGIVPDSKPRSTVIKDTPFQEYMKKKYVTPQELYRPKNKPDFRIRSLINELEKNRNEYAKQNRKFNEILG